MTPAALDGTRLLLAMSGVGESGIAAFVPFALVLGIFYFILFLPMKRRQKKVQAFLNALKVGDRVVTTGGIYGVVVKVSDNTVQLQVADKVRIEISKAAIGGYQGQEPVVAASSGQP